MKDVAIATCFLPLLDIINYSLASNDIAALRRR
jgi:hypothetical protein